MPAVSPARLGRVVNLAAIDHGQAGIGRIRQNLAFQSDLALIVLQKVRAIAPGKESGRSLDFSS